MIIAKKKAKALIADKITNNTEFFQIKASVTHAIPVSHFVNWSELKLNTSQNNQLAA
jgi:hypothetical protein